MMMHLIGLVLVTVAFVQARAFNNPILGDRSYTNPGAIKVNGTYYVVAEASNTASGSFPIHTSTDLISWELGGYAFDASNSPRWAINNTTLIEPEIHQIGSNYIIYFIALESSSTLLAVGAAIAAHPLGPYTAIDRPILPMLNESQDYPTIINDEDKIYLVWYGVEYSIHARQLNSNGLSYFSDQTFTIIKPSLTWEGNYTWSPWYIPRGSYHYLLYTGGKGCSTFSIGVARSSNALGPYEKLPNPILVPNSDYNCTRDISVVKDLDDKGYLIFFSAYRNDDVDQVLSVLLASLGWDDDDWPFIEDF